MTSTRQLLLEELIERGAGVVRRTRGGGRRRRGRARSRCVTGYGHARREPLALVRLVLRCDPHRDRFQALEPRRGFEVRALLAAVERLSALGTVALEVRVGRQRRGTVITPGRDDRLHQARKPGPGDVKRWTRALRPLFGSPAAIFAVGVHVAPLSVLPIVFHRRIHDLLWGSFIQWACSPAIRPAAELFRLTHPCEAKYKLSYSQGQKGLCGKPRRWRATGSGTRLKLHCNTPSQGIPDDKKSGRGVRAEPRASASGPSAGRGTGQDHLATLLHRRWLKWASASPADAAPGSGSSVLKIDLAIKRHDASRAYLVTPAGVFSV